MSVNMSLRELEKFTRYFVIKSIQIVVESRLGSERIKTSCNPCGNDWFNLCLNEMKDVNEQSKRCLESLTCKTSESCFTGFTVKASWRLCCEISLKTSEDETMTLEYWFIDNECTDVNKSSNVSSNLDVEIYEVYNRMSLLLKSLITLTRATPAYKISCRQSADSYVICYRVYQVEFSVEDFLKNKSDDENSHFTSEIKLGSIRNKENTINVSFSYRFDMSKTYQRNNEELTKCPQLLPMKTDHFMNENREKNSNARHCINKQLIAAFASPSNGSSFPLLPEAPFASLLTTCGDESNAENDVTVKENLTSKPIEIPESQKTLFVNSTGSANCSSSADSFVFVELKAPFASDDQTDLGSFFNGPSPSFTASGDLSDELSEISNQLAALESNVEQWDSFVDSICCPDEEEELK